MSVIELHINLQTLGHAKIHLLLLHSFIAFTAKFLWWINPQSEYMLIRLKKSFI